MTLALMSLAFGMATGVFLCLAYQYPEQGRLLLGIAVLPLLPALGFAGYVCWQGHLDTAMSVLLLVDIGAFGCVGLFVCGVLWYRFMTRAKQAEAEPAFAEEELCIRYGVVGMPVMTHAWMRFQGLPVSLPITMQPLLPNQRWFIDVPRRVTAFTVYHIASLHTDHGTFWEVAPEDYPDGTKFLRYVSPPAPATGRELERYTVSLKGEIASDA